MGRNLKHDRPELLLKDNFRRELEKATRLVDQPQAVDGWPSSMQPLVQNPKALKALAEFFRAVDSWTKQTDGNWSPLKPSKEVKDRFSHLRIQRVIMSSSNGLTVDDWLSGMVESDQKEADFRFVLNMFKDLWK